MKRMLLVLCVLLLLPVIGAQAELQQSKLLDAAFECVEEGNIFLERYQQLTGSTVKPRLKLGVPYFFGGQEYKTVFHHEPDYTTRKAWQNSDWYIKGKTYFSGFDCVGFVKYVYDRMGKAMKDDCSKLLEEGSHAYHQFCTDKAPMPEDWEELARELQPGDVWVLKHPGMHVMMFIGTLREFGFTAEELPVLADYLDYPLLMHCGAHPKYHDRMKAYAKASKKGYVRSTLPPDGGVAVSILGVPLDLAEASGECQDNTLWWFHVGNTEMTTFKHTNIRQYAWIRLLKQ